MHKKILSAVQKDRGRSPVLRPILKPPTRRKPGAVTFCLIRSASASVVAASIQDVCAIAAATAAKQENQDPHTAAVAKTIAAAIVAASAAAGEQKNDPDPVAASSCCI